jgi:hypothetical protein
VTSHPTHPKDVFMGALSFCCLLPPLLGVMPPAVCCRLGRTARMNVTVFIFFGHGFLIFYWST